MLEKNTRTIYRPGRGCVGDTHLPTYEPTGVRTVIMYLTHPRSTRTTSRLTPTKGFSFNPVTMVFCLVIYDPSVPMSIVEWNLPTCRYLGYLHVPGSNFCRLGCSRLQRESLHVTVYSYHKNKNFRKPIYIL